jgi:hypothetical protein
LPPRTISDITALLDQYKPDPEKVQELKAAASREPPTGVDKEGLSSFYHDRAQAAELLGSAKRQIDDLRRAEEFAAFGGVEWARIVRSRGHAEETNGSFAEGLETKYRLLSAAKTLGQRHSEHTGLVRFRLAVGDIAGATTELGNAETLFSQLMRTPSAWNRFQDLYIGQLEAARAQLFKIIGKQRLPDRHCGEETIPISGAECSSVRGTVYR